MRVNEMPPFANVGIDFAGPLYTRENLSTTTVKAWICLYTCCVTRAVHLEIVTEMTAVAFLRSFIRFTARRGTPVRILSDNGKAFIAASKHIPSILEHPHVKAHLVERSIRWQFNVERAPWWGGVFERLVQSVKRCLRKIIGSSRLTYDELMTAVIQVESLLNSRSLSYMSTDEITQPLTPSHLLTGRRISMLPDFLAAEEDKEYAPKSDSDVITRRMKHLRITIQQFWNRWKSEYLLELRNSHRGVKGIHSPSNVNQENYVAVGDVIIVEDERLPRGLWKLGVVTELLIGKDHEARAAMVRTSSRDGKPIILKRPIQKLYPLEVHETVKALKCIDSDLPGTEDVESSSTDQSSLKKPSRLKRRAAQEARERIQLWTEELNK